MMFILIPLLLFFITKGAKVEIEAIAVLGEIVDAGATSKI